MDIFICVVTGMLCGHLELKYKWPDYSGLGLALVLSAFVVWVFK